MSVERRRLSLLVKLLLVVAALVTLGAVVFLVDHGRRRLRTSANLDYLARNHRDALSSMSARLRLRVISTTPLPMTEMNFPDVVSHDGWGRAILYQCPGPIHRSGWDYWSVGPNGIDESGEGDDILIGEEVAPVASGR